MQDEAPDLSLTLHRIAGALGVPVEALFVPDLGQAGPSKAELDALVTIFTSLKDAQARNRIIAAALTEMQRLQSGPEIVPNDRL